MGRQVTLDELMGELIDACGKDAGMSAYKIIRDHLEAGDRLKLVHQPAVELPESMRQPTEPYFDMGYKVGDPDPTPADPPWCMARFRHPEGGDYCTLRPRHDGPHISGDAMKINAVFPWGSEVGYHENAGKTPEELGTDQKLDARHERAPLDFPDPSPGPDTVLWRMAEALREQVDNAPTISDRELRMMARLLVAVAEKVEQ